MIQRQVRQISDSGSVILTIPKNLAEILNLKPNNTVNIELVGKKIVISKAESGNIDTEEKVS